MAFEFFIEWGVYGLIILALVESIFSPIPNETVLIPLVLLTPEKWLLLGLIAGISSVVGGIFGYWLGRKIGRPILRKLFKEEHILKVEEYYKKYGDLGVFIGGFSPVPYKIFTVSSGAFKHNFFRFFIISTITRISRFMLVAYLIYVFREDIWNILSGSFIWITVLVAILAIIACLIWKKVKKS